MELQVGDRLTDETGTYQVIGRAFMTSGGKTANARVRRPGVRRADGEDLRRRPSITIAAGLLEKAGMIRYRRGHITILDREKLVASACECYHVVRREYVRLLAKD